MNGTLGICYLHPMTPKGFAGEEHVKSFLSAFGALLDVKVLKRQPMYELLLEFETPHSLNLAVETLCHSQSELGIITVCPFANTHPSPQAGAATSASLGWEMNHTPVYPRAALGPMGASDVRRYQAGRVSGSDSVSDSKSGAKLNASLSSPLSEALPVGRIPTLTDFIRPPSLDFPSPIPTPSDFMESLVEYPTTVPVVLRPIPGYFNYLFLKNLNVKAAKLSCILNLLGSFGNATNYLIDRKTDSGVFGFTTDCRIQAFVSCMQGQLFFGGHLICSLATSTFDLATVSSTSSERFYVGSENRKNHRYQHNLVIKFNPPSRLLHVTNVAEFMDQDRLFQLFSKYHQPSRIIKLRQRSATASEMFLAEFDQPHKAIEILSLFHNTNVADRSIKISFSHTKVDAHLPKSGVVTV